MRAKPCCIDGCDRLGDCCRGMCGPHYRRWYLYGDPLAPRPEPRAMRTLRELIAVETDECIIWPLGKTSNGYGKIRHQGKSTAAHAVSLELAVGPRPADKDVAAHSCRERACVNPRHLRWATSRENNVDDRKRDGTYVNGERTNVTVLDANKVRQIRSMHRLGDRPADIARRMGVNPATVRDVLSGRTWHHITDERGVA